MVFEHVTLLEGRDRNDSVSVDRVECLLDGILDHGLLMLVLMLEFTVSVEI